MGGFISVLATVILASKVVLGFACDESLVAIIAVGGANGATDRRSEES